MNLDEVTRIVKNLRIGGETSFEVDEPLSESEHNALAARLGFQTGFDLSVRLDSSGKNITVHRNN